jgi:hypothetical protein
VPPGVPLIDRLSNRQFRSELDELDQDHGIAITVRDTRTCRCGCGQTVLAARKFINQQHYNVWLSRERYVGKHLRAKPRFD